MSHCANCGTEVAGGARYCTTCGAPVETAAAGGPVLTRPAAGTVATQEEGLLLSLRQATLGEYEILGEIGRGGMAVVYLAHDLALDRKVAIKVMSPALMMMDTGVRERFKREARTAAALSHPHIIPVFAVKESGDLVYFVMKFIVGRSLESVIKEVGPMPIPVVQTVLGQVGGALGHAHKHGVVHRDMKPGNVMLDEDGWVVVTDFGIAKVADAEALTQTGGMVGTPAYMSPEQCAGSKVTGASDQYSLGIMAYEMITGRQPFSGGTLVNLIYDHCHTPPPTLLDTRPDCPPEIAAAVMRMLEKDPASRWPSVEEAVAAIGVAAETQHSEVKTQILTLVQSGGTRTLLDKFRTPGSPVPLTGALKRASAARPPAASAAPAQTAPARKARASPLRWVLPLVALVALGGVWMVLRGPRGEVSAVAPPQPAAPPGGPGIARLELAPLTVSLAPGERATMRATGRDAAGSVMPHAAVTWESSNPQVATVSSEGLVLAAAPGVAQVMARRGASSAAAVVTVTARAERPRLPERVPAGASLPARPAAETTAQGRTAAVAPGAAAPAAPVAPPPAAAAAGVRDTHRVTVEETPPPPRLVDPRPEIERALDAYRRAIESRDLAQLRAAYPGMSADQERAWRVFFGNVTELSAALKMQDLQVSGDRAEANVAGTYDFRSRTRQTQHVAFLAAFERGAAGWRLMTIK